VRDRGLQGGFSFFQDAGAPGGLGEFVGKSQGFLLPLRQFPGGLLLPLFLLGQFPGGLRGLLLLFGQFPGEGALLLLHDFEPAGDFGKPLRERAVLLFDRLGVKRIEAPESEAGFGGKDVEKAERRGGVVFGLPPQFGNHRPHGFAKLVAMPQSFQKLRGQRRGFQVLYIGRELEAQPAGYFIDFRVVTQGHGGHAGGGGEDEGMQPHAEDQVAGAQPAADLIGAALGGHHRAPREPHMLEDPAGRGAVVFPLARNILKRNQHDGPAGLLDKNIQRRGDFALQEIGMHPDAPMAGRHAEDRPAQRKALGHRLFETGGGLRHEQKPRIGRDPDPLARNAQLFQQRFRRLVAHRDGLRRLGRQARVLPAVPGIQRPHADGVQHQRLAIQRCQQGRAGVVGHAPMPVGEKGVRVHAPIVVKQPSAAQQHQVGGLHGGVKGGHIVPGDRLHGVRGDGLLRIAGCHQQAQVRPARPKAPEDGRQDGFIADIAETVITDEKNGPGISQRIVDPPSVVAAGLPASTP